MRLSLWQQFSSNHSSSFTVVGEFNSRQEAEHAADIIRGMLKKIADWNTQNPEDSDKFWNNVDLFEDVSPPELELAQQYDIRWEGTIDWFRDPKIKIVLDRFVFVQPGHRPEGGGQPLDQIMDVLGGKGYLESDIYGDTIGLIIFDLTCAAPDNKTASAIYEQYLGYERRIKRNGKQLTFYHWRFDESPDLPELVEQLTQQGCKNIEYNLTQLEPSSLSMLHKDDDLATLLSILENGHYLSDRADAAESLGKLGDVRAVNQLITALEVKDEWFVRSVTVALGQIGDSKAVQSLIALFPSVQEEWTRQAIVTALERIRDSRAIPLLVENLCKPEISDWQQSANAVARFGVDARLPLVKLSQDDNREVAERALHALKMLEDTLVGGELLESLRSRNESIRKNALQRAVETKASKTLITFLEYPGNGYDLVDDVAEALGNMRDASAVPSLVKHLESYSARPKVAAAVIKFGPSAIEPLWKLMETLLNKPDILNWASARVQIMSLLVALGGSDDVERVFRMINEDLKLLGEDIYALRMIATPQAIDQLIKLLHAAQAWEKTSVAQALVSTRDPIALAAVHNANQNSPYPILDVDMYLKMIGP